MISLPIYRRLLIKKQYWSHTYKSIIPFSLDQKKNNLLNYKQNIFSFSRSKNYLSLNRNKYSFSNNLVKNAFNQLLNHRYSRLCRWQKPIGALLLFWPCLWGIQVGANNLFMAQNFVPYYLLFLMGSWTSRSAGCIINDYLDKDFDRNVERCKNRPLASGEVTTKQAVKLLFLNLCGGLIVLSQMNINALIATFMILPVSALYPLAKRYVKHPQAVLASAFNSGVIICALTVNPLSPSWEILIATYLSGICWTMIYDTIYAFQDINDDKKLGLKSTAIEWEASIMKRMNQMLVSSLLLTSSLAYFNPFYVYSLPFFIGAHAFLKMQLNKLDITNRQSCGNFFKKNNIFGIMIFLGLLTKRMVEQSSMQKDANKKQK